MRIKDVAMLLLLAALWGGSFLFMRIAAPVLGPVVLAELRVGIAGIALLVYAAAIRSLPAFRAQGAKYLLLGALNAAIPYTLIGAAELRLTTSLASILNATTPLFAAVVAAVWLKDRLDAKRGIGLVLGIVGVAILVGWSPLALNAIIVLSVGASLGAALSYALAGIFSKVAFSGMPPLALAIGQQLGAGLLLLPLALPTAVITRPGQGLSVGVALAVIALALLCTSLAYLLYFSLIASVGPMKTLSVTYLVPVFGIIWSALFLHERLHAGTLIGLAIILASVALVTGAGVRV
ncbi:MAG: DMT family transporter, partial [Thermomicrobia bacterium]|nr:DMT family transporter [Thermomicrobia bacterium]